MPNTRKSRVERLPRSERRHASSKILVLPPPPTPLPSPPASLAVPARLTPGVQPARPRLPRLDDEVLAKILMTAGAGAVLAARGVCTQWRAVAEGMLSRVSRVDVGKMYAASGGGRLSPPSYAQVVRMLAQFPNLRALAVQNWLYEDVMEDVAGYLCGNYEGVALVEAEFSGVLMGPTCLRQLLRNCPNVRRLRLGEHDSIDDALLSDFGSYCKQRRRQEAGYNLQSIHISRARSVSHVSLAVLLEHAWADSIVVSKCNRLRDVRWMCARGSPMQRLSLTGCNNLRHFSLRLQAAAEDVLELNLSQCIGLESMSIVRAAGNNDKRLSLRRLNLSGCRNLREITIPSHDPEVLTSWKYLCNLEELILFGTHALRVGVFSQVFGLTSETCSLPNLRRLTLNGCALDTLVVKGYPRLSYLDCSGCAYLGTLVVENCWKIETFIALGRRSPLTRVQLVLSGMCDVRGIRREWHWEKHASNQRITFP